LATNSIMGFQLIPISMTLQTFTQKDLSEVKIFQKKF